MTKKLLLVLALLLMPGVAWGATITRYVNTASAGGNGTTNELSGANAAYASLFAWEAAENCNLTDNGGDIMVVNCSGTTADTTAVTIGGWTTSATCYIQIIGNYAVTSGTHLSSSYYTLAPSSGAGITITGLSDTGCIKISKLQIDMTNGSGNAIVGDNYTANVTINNCVIKAKAGVNGINFQQLRGNSYIYNNVIYNATGNYIRGIWAYGTTNQVRIYNNTIYNCTRSISCEDSVSTVLVSNNLTMSITADSGAACLTNVARMSGSDNATSDATGDDSPLTNGIVNHTDYASYFVATASADFHLKSTATDFIDAGADLSGTFTTDIDGETRSTFDIGADEYTAAAPATRRIIMVY